MKLSKPCLTCFYLRLRITHLKHSVKTFEHSALNTNVGPNESASLHQIKSLLRIFIIKLLLSPNRSLYEEQLSAEPRHCTE